MVTRSLASLLEGGAERMRGGGSELPQSALRAASPLAEGALGGARYYNNSQTERGLDTLRPRFVVIQYF